MSIENSFDSKSKALISPEDIYGIHDKFADICIVTFSRSVLDKVLKLYSCKKVAYTGTANGKIPIYYIETAELNVLFYMSPIGAAIAGTIMDEVRVLTGASKFIVFGSCGILDKDKCEGKIIVPSAAYRDEGFSYHFIKADDYISIEKCSEISKFFEINDIAFTIGKTWTTDAFYRETINNIDLRIKEGCICVEMECAGLQALCNFRNIYLYPFFFGGDLLNNSSWERNTLGLNTEKEYQIASFSVALSLAKWLYCNI
ncbi:MAG: nucleoside phosphorylase [Sphaerochaetaceae bacterium]|nr:nucleoside phosphorylase [Bacilli bacterium]MCF0237970.1 nucleoside phosphorylase [Sphaerochaetaceae bacterium]